MILKLKYLSKYESWINIILLTIGLIGAFYIVVFSINKGFDTTDEGLYLLLADPLQDFNFSIFNHDIIFKFLYNVFGIQFNLVELRVLRLTLNISSSFFLAFAIKKYININQSLKDNIIYYLCILFFSFVSYIVWPKAPGYNIFALHFTILSTGVLLLFIKIKNRYLKGINIIFLTLSLVFLFATKVSTFVLIFALQLVLLFFLSSKENRLKNVIVIVLGFFVMHFIWTLYFPKLGFLNILSTIQNHSGNHNMFHLLIGYHGQLPILIYVYLLGTLFNKVITFFKNKEIAFHVYFILITIHIFLLDLYISEQSIRLILLIIFILGLVLSQLNIKKNQADLYLLIYFLILPFAMHFGSDTGMVDNLIGYSFVFIFPIVIYGKNYITKSLVVLVLTVFILKALHSNLISKPARQVHVNELDKQLSINGHSFYTDDRLFNRIKKLEDIINKYNPKVKHIVAPHKLVGETALLEQTAYFNPIWGKLWGDDDFEIIKNQIQQDVNLEEFYFITNNLLIDEPIFVVESIKNYSYIFVDSFKSSFFDGREELINVFYLRRNF